MVPATGYASSFVVSLTCTAAPVSSLQTINRKIFPYYILIYSLLFFSFHVSAQDSSVIHIDSAKPATVSFINNYPARHLTDKQVKNRVRTVSIINVAGYAAILAGLNTEWYAAYPRSNFHSFNDNAEWLQVDKVGHMYGSYIESRTSAELWRWTGIDRKKRIWLGGLSGAVYQTIIETLDGFSAEWGWSWGDFSANIVGSAAFIGQELAWDDQRIKIKFSFHRNSYGDAELRHRADSLFGKTLAESFIKDYNAQTYWASAGLKSFFSQQQLTGLVSCGSGLWRRRNVRGKRQHRQKKGRNNFFQPKRNQAISSMVPVTRYRPHQNKDQ